MTVPTAAFGFVALYLGLGLTTQVLYGPVALVGALAVLLGPLIVTLAILPWPGALEKHPSAQTGCPT